MRLNHDDHGLLVETFFDQAFGPLFTSLKNESQIQTCMTILSRGLSSKSPSATFHIQIDENDDETEVKDMLAFLNEKGLISIKSDLNEIKESGVFLKMESRPMTIWPSREKQEEYVKDVNAGLTLSIEDANDALELLREKQRKYEQRAALYANRAKAHAVDAAKTLSQGLVRAVIGGR